MSKKQGARRYQIKRTPKHWVTRDKFGRFKEWTSKEWAAPIERAKKAKKRGVKSGYGDTGDRKK